MDLKYSVKRLFGSDCRKLNCLNEVPFNRYIIKADSQTFFQALHKFN